MGCEMWLRSQCFDPATLLANNIKTALWLNKSPEAIESLNQAYAKAREVVAHLQRALQAEGASDGKSRDGHTDKPTEG
jgi:hypothetical protein